LASFGLFRVENMIGLDRAIQTNKLNRTGYLNNSYVVRQAQGFKWWNELSSQEEMHLLEQVNSLDFKFIRRCSK